MNTHGLITSPPDIKSKYIYITTPHKWDHVMLFITSNGTTPQRTQPSCGRGFEGAWFLENPVLTTKPHDFLVGGSQGWPVTGRGSHAKLARSRAYKVSEGKD